MDKNTATKKMWHGSENCDFCQKDVHKVAWFVDGKTVMGPWGLMCKNCYPQYGVGGFGQGLGQKYSGKTFEKIAG